VAAKAAALWLCRGAKQAAVLGTLEKTFALSVRSLPPPSSGAGEVQLEAERSCKEGTDAGPEKAGFMSSSSVRSSMCLCGKPYNFCGSLL